MINPQKPVINLIKVCNHFTAILPIYVLFCDNCVDFTYASVSCITYSMQQKQQAPTCMHSCANLHQHVAAYHLAYLKRACEELWFKVPVASNT